MVQTFNRALRILRLKQVLERTGKSRSSVYQDMANGLFPSNIRIGARSVGWLESDISDFIQSRITEYRNLVNGGA